MLDNRTREKKLYKNIFISRCLRQTAAHPCGRTHRFRSKILEKSQPKNSKIHQVGSQNPSSWAPKSIKLGSKIKKNQSWEVSGGVLGPSWPQDPPKTTIYLQNQFLGPLLGTHLGGQNPPKINCLGFQEVLIF